VLIGVVAEVGACFVQEARLEVRVVEAEGEHNVDEFGNQLSVLVCLIAAVFLDQPEHAVDDLITYRYTHLGLEPLQAELPESRLPHLDEVGALEVQEHVSKGLHLETEVDPDIAEESQERDRGLRVAVLHRRVSLSRVLVHLLHVAVHEVTDLELNLISQSVRLSHLANTGHFTMQHILCNCLH